MPSNNFGSFGQQPEPMFSFFDRLEETVHDLVPWCFGTAGAIAGYLYASSHDLFIPLLAAGGFLAGFLAVKLLMLALKGLLILAILAAVVYLAIHFGMTSKPTGPRNHNQNNAQHSITSGASALVELLREKVSL